MLMQLDANSNLKGCKAQFILLPDKAIWLLMPGEAIHCGGPVLIVVIDEEMQKVQEKHQYKF